MENENSNKQNKVAANKPKTSSKKTVQPIKSRETQHVQKTAKTEQSKPIIPKDIDIMQYITVRNGFHGRLVYKSRRTGETYIWDTYGSEQEMELRELKDAKNSAKKFFINNWFMFDDTWVMDYLGVRQFYKNAISIDRFDDIFKKPPVELKKTIKEMSDGQKRSVAYRANELVREKKIDSLAVISALEEALHIELIEK